MDWFYLISGKTYNFYFIHKHSVIINKNCCLWSVNRMYEIVNEPNLTIAFDMDTELSQFGVFGVCIKQGYNICAGYIDPSDWSGIHRGYKELVALYANCKGTATFTYVLTEEGDTLTFSLNQKGALTMEINICTIYNYKCHMIIESLDQTYLPKFIEFFKVFLEKEPK